MQENGSIVAQISIARHFNFSIIADIVRLKENQTDSYSIISV